MKRVWGKVDVFVVFISCLQGFPDSPHKQFVNKTDDDFDGDGYSEMWKTFNGLGMKWYFY